MSNIEEEQKILNLITDHMDALLINLFQNAVNLFIEMLRQS